MRASALLWMVLPTLAFGQAEELENPGSVSAVQEREFRMNHELSFGVGVLPLDAFYKGVTAQVAYTYHFNDHFAWQVGRAAYSFNIDTALKSQLLNQFGVLPTAFPEVQAMVGSDLVWAPLYGKLAVMNKSVIHFEGFFVLGGSLLYLINQSGQTVTGSTSTSLPFRPAVNFGVGMRVFNSKHVSWRLDVTNNVVISDRGIFNVPTLQLNAAVNFGATE